MKNVSCIINGTIALAVIAFSVLFFSSCKETGTSTPTQNVATEGEGLSGAKLPIAYVNIDSLLINYEFAKEMNEGLTKKMEDIRVTINQKTKKLEKDGADFQHKMQNNAFLSQERAEQEYNRIQKQQMELEQTAQRLQNDWMTEQHQVNQKITDSVRVALKKYNETAKYEVIFNMREFENILLANPAYDITEPVLTLLNSRYSKAAADKK